MVCCCDPRQGSGVARLDPRCSARSRGLELLLCFSPDWLGSDMLLGRPREGAEECLLHSKETPMYCRLLVGMAVLTIKYNVSSG